jgi:hypothetical protein
MMTFPRLQAMNWAAAGLTPLCCLAACQLWEWSGLTARRCPSEHPAGLQRPCRTWQQNHVSKMKKVICTMPLQFNGVFERAGHNAAARLQPLREHQQEAYVPVELLAQQACMALIPLHHVA